MREEISELAGVTAVEVDLGAGRVDVSAEGVLSASDVQRAVQEAGYELVAVGAARCVIETPMSLLRRLVPHVGAAAVVGSP